MSVPYHTAAISVNTLQVSCRFPKQAQVSVSWGVSETGMFSTDDIMSEWENTDVDRLVRIKSED